MVKPCTKSEIAPKEPNGVHPPETSNSIADDCVSAIITMEEMSESEFQSPRDRWSPEYEEVNTFID